MRAFRPSLLRVGITGALLAFGSACTDFSTTPASLGRVTVAVTDQNNAGVAGQTVNLIRVGSVNETWRSFRTGSDGTGEFGKTDGGVISQDYIVEIVPETQYELASGETNNKPVTVVVGQIHPVTFKLKKREIAPPPSG